MFAAIASEIWVRLSSFLCFRFVVSLLDERLKAINNIFVKFFFNYSDLISFTNNNKIAFQTYKKMSIGFVGDCGNY